MSNMEKIRPLLRQQVMLGTDHLILPAQWEEAFAHIGGTDITADAVTLAIAEARKEREDLETLRARSEPIEGK